MRRLVCSGPDGMNEIVLRIWSDQAKIKKKTTLSTNTYKYNLVGA